MKRLQRVIPWFGLGAALAMLVDVTIVAEGRRAAALEARRCPVCEGAGVAYRGGPVPFLGAGIDGVGRYYSHGYVWRVSRKSGPNDTYPPMRCPKCQGSGLLPEEEPAAR